jgi:hypothetical protein
LFEFQTLRKWFIRKFLLCVHSILSTNVCWQSMWNSSDLGSNNSQVWFTMDRNNPLRWSKSLSDLRAKNINFWQNVLDSQVRKGLLVFWIPFLAPGCTSDKNWEWSWGCGWGCPEWCRSSGSLLVLNQCDTQLCTPPSPVLKSRLLWTEKKKN